MKNIDLEDHTKICYMKYQYQDIFVTMIVIETIKHTPLTFIVLYFFDHGEQSKLGLQPPKNSTMSPAKMCATKRRGNVCVSLSLY